MRTRFLMALLAVALGFMTLVGARPAQAQGCQYVLGFAAIYNQIPGIVGPCRSNEEYDSNGNSNQHTANGMMQWRKADNFTAFTDGYRSWVNGPCGLEMRLNTQRFPWEANPEGLAVVSSRCQAAAPAPAAPAAPAGPTTTINDETVTVTDNEIEVVGLRRLSRPPEQLTGAASKRVDEATVQLVRLTDDSIGIATGAVVGNDGRTVLTAFHVVGDLETGKTHDSLLIAVGPYMDYRLRATVVATDPENDLAVLRVREAPGFGGFTTLPLADSDAVQLGQGAYVYSYPARGEGVLGRSTGSVLFTSTNVKEGRRVALVTEAHASPGSSGGVVVNSRGEVMGIISRGVRLSRGIDRLNLPTITQLTLYVPINLARPLLAQAGAQ